MRPIHDYVCACEHTRVSQLNFIFDRLSIPPRGITRVKTDTLILSVPAKKLSMVKAVSELRFDQLHTLRRDRELPNDPT